MNYKSKKFWKYKIFEKPICNDLSKLKTYNSSKITFYHKICTKKLLQHFYNYCTSKPFLISDSN